MILDLSVYFSAFTNEINGIDSDEDRKFVTDTIRKFKQWMYCKTYRFIYEPVALSFWKNEKN